MINKRLLSIFICLTCLISFISAEKIEAGSLKNPNGKNVILVGKVSLKTPINIEARRGTFKKTLNSHGKFKDDTYYYIGDGVQAENKPMVGESGYSRKLLKEMFNPEPKNKPAFGETFFTEVRSKEGSFTINYFMGALFPNLSKWYIFEMPANVTITIPEGVEYVYVGNFEYDLDYALRVVGFNHYDEYESAQEELNKATGKNVQLYKAELTFNKKK